MELMVNGKPMELADGTTAAGLLERLQVHPERVVVEVNLAIVKRGQLPSTALKPGDQVEIVHFVGGGA
jgi:sulfur carrier protein